MELAVGEPIERLRFVLSSCLQVLLTNGWPVLQEPYVQEPLLIDEDRIGGSAIAEQVLKEQSRCAPHFGRFLSAFMSNMCWMQCDCLKSSTQRREQGRRAVVQRSEGVARTTVEG